ncbi:MAG: glycosyltransferase family 2 protein [Oscillochloris sp.]|nr:glycosyltransferase family 2 protein [Oscillochloris sp.]
MINSASRLSIGEARFRDHPLATVPVHTTVLIPAYNEEQALPHVIESILAVIDESYEILVIDDGSQDKTCEIAKSYACRVISHDINRGKGAAMKTGFTYARGEKIIVIDGDATYPADTIPEIVRQLDRHDIVRCVRSVGRDNIPLINRLGNKFFDTLISTVHQVEGSDMLSGLYGLHRHHLTAMRLDSDGFDIETEIMVRAQAMTLTAHNIPIQYNERIGEKKLKPVRDGLSILLRILRLMAIFNPFATYIIPGLVLWAIGILVLIVLSGGPIHTPFAQFSTNTLIVSSMAFLAGFQLLMLGGVVDLYGSQQGLRKPNKIFMMLASQHVRLWSYSLSIFLAFTGLCWFLVLNWNWIATGHGIFKDTDSLVVALALVVWGIQLLSTTLFLALFARQNNPNAPTVNMNVTTPPPTADTVPPVVEPMPLECEVGGSW